jgi:hypothetical protein
MNTIFSFISNFKLTETAGNYIPRFRNFPTRAKPENKGIVLYVDTGRHGIVTLNSVSLSAG